MEGNLITRGPELHIRYEGNSYDATLADLDIGDLSTDAHVRQMAARHLNVPAAKLSAFAIDRNTSTGDITLRPQATFG